MKDFTDTFITQHICAFHEHILKIWKIVKKGKL